MKYSEYQGEIPKDINTRIFRSMFTDAQFPELLVMGLCIDMYKNDTN